MSKTSKLILCFLFFFTRISAQDAYHTWLQNKLQTDFNLTQQFDWVLSNNENTTLSKASNYGATYTTVNVSGQPLTRATRANITAGN